MDSGNITFWTSVKWLKIISLIFLYNRFLVYFDTEMSIRLNQITYWRCLRQQRRRFLRICYVYLSVGWRRFQQKMKKPITFGFLIEVSRNMSQTSNNFLLISTSFVIFYKAYGYFSFSSLMFSYEFYDSWYNQYEWMHEYI